MNNSFAYLSEHEYARRPSHRVIDLSVMRAAAFSVKTPSCLCG